MYGGLPRQNKPCVVGLRVAVHAKHAGPWHRSPSKDHVLARGSWQFSCGQRVDASTIAPWLLPSDADFSTPGPLGPCGVFGA